MLHWPDAWSYQGPLRNLAAKSPAEQEELTFPTDADGNRATVDSSLPETWRRLETLVDRGLTRTLGLCNVSLDQLTTVVDVARVLPAIIQIESHPYQPRTALVQACHERGIRVMAHSPLSASGLLGEPTLHEIADAKEVSPAAVVLAWNVERGVVPIPSSIDPQHIVGNLAAARVRLTDEEMARIGTLADPASER
jgi:diketogulonate reductase-like aldo/keto reductase